MAQQRSAATSCEAASEQTVGIQLRLGDQMLGGLWTLDDRGNLGEHRVDRRGGPAMLDNSPLLDTVDHCGEPSRRFLFLSLIGQKLEASWRAIH